MSIDTELKSIVTLLDDTDDFVVDAINKRMLGRGTSVLTDLEELYNREKSYKTKGLIADKIQFLSNEFVLEEFEGMLMREYPDLERGIYLISKLIVPDIDEIYFKDLIGILIKDLVEEINEKKTALEKMQIFNHIFYHRLLFKCGDYPVTRESTTLLTSVLSSRHGIPLSISLVYFLLARCVGLEVYPMRFPGGFVPSYVENNKILFYMDIFRDGEIFSESRLKYYLENQGVDIDTSAFEVRDDRTLILVYLEMLHFMYTQKEDEYTIAILDRALKLFGDERVLETGEGDLE
jgi:regulator of sirC expression with transglutaminase-like and TPR domain